jgi:hypothetical protein
MCLVSAHAPEALVSPARLPREIRTTWSCASISGFVWTIEVSLARLWNRIPEALQERCDVRGSPCRVR